MKNVCIIGGGAAGLFCAAVLKAKDKNASVTVYEKNDRVGKKLLATGNGRCNLTNLSACDIEKGLPIHYFGKDRCFCIDALNQFTPHDLINFFVSFGMPIRNENGKIYPYSSQAGTVLDILRFYCESNGVVIATDSMINSITYKNNKFIVNNERYDICVVACGGKASPHLCSDGLGYDLLIRFGHKLTPLLPAITQIKTDTTFAKQLKGVKCDAEVKIIKNDRVIRSEFGELLFCDYGLSGPPILQLSSSVNQNCVISADVMPEYSVEKIIDMFKKNVQNPFYSEKTAQNLILPVLNKRLGQVIVKYAGYSLSEPISNISFRHLARCIKDFRFKVTGVQSFQNAQVTAGGIETKYFDNKTMQSRLVNGLYAIGEILDIHGDCGGYNLQWAFSSAYSAAKDISEKLR